MEGFAFVYIRYKLVLLFYHYRARGDVVAITDQNGQVVANCEYDAWGNVLKGDAKGIAADNPFGYAGYMYDKEIGMYYLIARYYNPDHGVFLSVDPDGHCAYRPWGTTQLWVYDDRTAYANSRGVKAGIKGWAESYSFNFMGGGNVVSKLGSFITGASKGWKQSKTKCKVKASQVKVGNRKAMQSVLKSAGKQAIKAAIVRGSNKAVGVSSKVILNAVKTGEKVIQSGGRTKSTSKQAVVVLNKKGKVITTFAKGSK